MIPSTLHFVYISGLSPDLGGKPFSFVHWAAIRSAQLANPGWRTIVWTQNEPTGRFWDAIRGFVHVKAIEPPEAVYGRPVPHVAHKCDYLRLKVLHEHGGVYLDCDTITVKPFDGFVHAPVTMVAETANDTTVGLCNAFIAAEPGAQFITDWLAKFSEFRSNGHDEFWNESGVQWPRQLWEAGGHCNVRPASAYMIPDWTHDGIRAMFYGVNEYPNAIGHHLWESGAWSTIKNYTPESYRETDCTYSRLLEKHLGDEIRKAFS